MSEHEQRDQILLTTVTAEVIEALGLVAGLPLTPERQRLLAPLLQGFLAGIRRLESLDFGEVPPAFAFDPRWE